ncbi:hypothetical protein [Paenibacillus thalictri]|nr:hypothetical protein [Paenibacillus thalictri]
MAHRQLWSIDNFSPSTSYPDNIARLIQGSPIDAERLAETTAGTV